MVPAPFDDSGAQPEFDRAIAILEGELRVVFASPVRESRHLQPNKQSPAPMYGGRAPDV